MQLIRVDKENIEKEHICCAISNSADAQVTSKKTWLNKMFGEGLVFLKGDVRGKCFIEYLPAENAWVPIDAEGYMFINCLWVSGKYKGHGNSNLLIDACIKDSQDKKKLGICIISSKKKMAFLSDIKYLRHKGFLNADSASPYFELMYLPFRENAPKPRFFDRVKTPETGESGFSLYYTFQCPFTAKYVPILEEAAQNRKIEFKSILLDSREKAKNAPAAATTFALFYNGKFVTHEMLSADKFEKIIEKLTD